MTNAIRHLIIPMVFLGGLLESKGQAKKDPPFDLGFQTGRTVCAIQIDSKRKLCVDSAADPCLSASGMRLAYTKSEELRSGLKRYINILDLDSGKTTKLNVNSENYYGAMWSPDDHYLAFSILVNKKWQVGIIGSNNTEFKILNAGSNIELHSPAWTSSGKYIVAHNQFKLFKFDLTGKLVETIDLKKLLGKDLYFSGSSIFLYTPDNKYLIFDAGIQEYMGGLDQPIEAVFAFNFDTKEMTRLSPKGMYASEPYVKQNNEIYFSGTSNLRLPKKIYKTNLKNNSLKIVIDKGSKPTACSVK